MRRSPPPRSLSATLSGRVVDESGAVVPHVRVVIIDLTTGRERKTETSDRGEFVLHGLAPARYQLTAQRDGFAPLQVPDIELHANDVTVLHLKLEVSPIGEILVVEVNRVQRQSVAGGEHRRRSPAGGESAAQRPQLAVAHLAGPRDGTDVGQRLRPLQRERTA